MPGFVGDGACEDGGGHVAELGEGGFLDGGGHVVVEDFRFGGGGGVVALVFGEVLDLFFVFFWGWDGGYR